MKSEHRKYIQEHYKKQSAKHMAVQLGIKERTVQRFLDNLKGRIEQQAQEEEQKIKSKHKISWALLLIVLACSFFAYANSLGGELIWDDNILVKNNVEIRSWTNLKKVIFGNLGGESLYYKHSSYRPVQTISYMVDFSLGQFNPFYYRLTSVICHMLVAGVFYWLLFIIYKSNFISFTAALLYTLHPIHTEAVAYISGRADPLSSIFMLLTMCFYFKYLQRKHFVWLLGMLVSYLLGILSRENALMVPLFIFVYHFAYQKKIAWKPTIAFSFLAVVYVILRVTETIGGMGLREPVKTAITARIPGFLVALSSYFKLLIWPFDLHMEYGRPLFPMTDSRAIVGLVIFIVLIFLAMHQRKKRPIITFGILWFLIGLFPVSNIVIVVNAFMAEHWLYFPSMGLFLMLGYAFKELYQKDQWRYGVGFAIAAAAVFFGVRTHQQNTTWLESVAFYERTRTFAPKSARLRADLGEAYYSKGRKEDALQSTLEAIRLRPSYYAAYSNLGTIYMSLGQPEKAIEAYRNSLRVNPRYFNAWFNLANVYKDRKEYKKAISAYENAIHYKPSLANAYNNVGICYSRIGEKEKAIQYYKQGIKLNPRNNRFYNNLASTYSDLGRHNEAISLYNKALQLNPNRRDVPIIYYNLALGYARIGDQENATKAFQTANTIPISSPAVYRQLAGIYTKTGLKAQAQYLNQKALDLEKK